jgi:DNA-binding transcriptional ArsR family regulator
MDPMTTPALQVIRRSEPAAAVLDPVRQQLLAHLAEPDSAAGLARRLGLPRQRINYHLRALEAAGLIELVEERRKGNCFERVVRATARSFVISPEVLGVLGPGPETAADRLSSAYLVAAAGRVIRDVGALEVRFASAEKRAEFARELTEALARLAAKYHDERASGGRRFRLLAAVHPTPTEDASHGKDSAR